MNWARLRRNRWRRSSSLGAKPKARWLSRSSERGEIASRSANSATEGGSTEDNAKILRFGLKDQAKLLDENMKLIQAMSSPEGQAKWKQVMAQIGAVEPKPVVKEFTVGQGAKHVMQLGSTIHSRRRSPVGYLGVTGGASRSRQATRLFGVQDRTRCCSQGSSRPATMP